MVAAILRAAAYAQAGERSACQAASRRSVYGGPGRWPAGSRWVEVGQRPMVLLSVDPGQTSRRRAGIERNLEPMWKPPEFGPSALTLQTVVNGSVSEGRFETYGDGRFRASLGVDVARKIRGVVDDPAALRQYVHFMAGEARLDFLSLLLGLYVPETVNETP